MSRFKWEIHVTQEGDHMFRATLFAERHHHRCATGRNQFAAVRALLDVLDTPIDPNDPLLALVDRSGEALEIAPTSGNP